MGSLWLLKMTINQPVRNLSVCSSVLQMQRQLSTTTFHQPPKVLSSTVSSSYIEQKRWAGHSKWQNIRHIKAAKDTEKMKVADYITRKIRLVIAETGSTDPKLNTRLANVLQEGKNKGIPNSTMMTTLKKLSEKKAGSKLVVFEAKAMLNSFFMIEALTDRRTFIKNQLKNILRKYGGEVGDNGFASHSFNQKGVLYVPLKQGEGKEDLNEESAMELAIEADAEEVELTVDDGNQKAFQFTCEMKQLHKVKKELEARDIVVTDARLEFIPHIFNHLKPEDLTKAGQLLDELENSEDIMKVYSNIKAEGEL